MTTQTRVFTVDVTGCKACPHGLVMKFCDHPDLKVPATLKQAFHSTVNIEKALDVYRENYFAITESCPMYQHSFVKDEKK